MRLLSVTVTSVTKTYIEIHSVFIKCNGNLCYLTRITITHFWLSSNCLYCARSVV